MPTVSCGITPLGKMLTWTVPLSTQGKYGDLAMVDVENPQIENPEIENPEIENPRKSADP